MPAALVLRRCVVFFLVAATCPIIAKPAKGQGPGPGSGAGAGATVSARQRQGRGTGPPYPLTPTDKKAIKSLGALRPGTLKSKGIDHMPHMRIAEREAPTSRGATPLTLVGQRGNVCPAHARRATFVLRPSICTACALPAYYARRGRDTHPRIPVT